jgi:hypothetical protein
VVDLKIRPATFTSETTTVWSFPNRGDRSTHVGNYRGNWSPYIPRNFILRYTQPGELVLDQMMGSGTTLVECKLLGRRAVGEDINPDVVIETGWTLLMRRSMLITWLRRLRLMSEMRGRLTLS